MRCCGSAAPRRASSSDMRWSSTAVTRSTRRNHERSASRLAAVDEGSSGKLHRDGANRSALSDDRAVTRQRRPRHLRAVRSFGVAYPPARTAVTRTGLLDGAAPALHAPATRGHQEPLELQLMMRANPAHLAASVIASMPSVRCRLAVALEQRHAQLVFQLFDLLAQRRLRETKYRSRLSCIVQCVSCAGYCSQCVLLEPGSRTRCAAGRCG